MDEQLTVAQMSAQPVTVLVVEDDAMVRGWLTLLLEGSEFRSLGEAASASDARALVRRRCPDLLLVDYRLPDQLGTELVKDLRQHGLPTPAVLMTANAERGFNELAREAGAHGTVLKTGSPEEVVNALRAVADGGNAFDARHPRRTPGAAPLTPRERQVLRLIAGGATNRQVAETLSIGDETVKTLLTRSYGKLGVARRAEAVSRAHQLGLL